MATKILFYTDTGGATGGPGMHTVRVYEAFRARWPELVGPFAFPGSEEDRRIFARALGDERLRALGTETLEDGGADPVRVRPDFYRALVDLARREGCDHVHVLWGFLAPEQVDAVPEAERLPVTITLCDATGRGEDADVDQMFFGSERWERYLREALRVELGYLAISDKTRRQALDKGVRPELVETAHLWITPEAERHRTDDVEDYVAFVGGLADYKGLAHVLDLALAYPEIPIRIAGYTFDDFPVDWARYPSVTFLGYLPSYEDVLRLVARARALLYLSYSEGFGLPMLEAQLLGVPLVVNPRNHMVHELLARGSYVSAGDVGSPTSLKVAVDVATRDRARLRDAGLANARRFDEGRLVEHLRDALQTFGTRAVPRVSEMPLRPAGR